MGSLSASSRSISPKSEMTGSPSWSPSAFSRSSSVTKLRRIEERADPASPLFLEVERFFEPFGGKPGLDEYLPDQPSHRGPSPGAAGRCRSARTARNPFIGLQVGGAGGRGAGSAGSGAVHGVRWARSSDSGALPVGADRISGAGCRRCRHGLLLPVLPVSSSGGAWASASSAGRFSFRCRMLCGTPRGLHPSCVVISSASSFVLNNIRSNKDHQIRFFHPC